MRKLILDIVSPFLVISSAFLPLQVNATSRQERMDARAITKVNISSPQKDPKKPNCSKPGQSKWKCSAWSVCSYTDSTWKQTRDCTLDALSPCIEIGFGPVSQSCKPSTAQYQSQKNLQQQQLQQAQQKKAEADSQKAKELQAAQLEDLKIRVNSYYKSMQESQKQHDKVVTLFTGTTSMQLFELSNQYNAKVSQMKIYTLKASLGTLVINDSLDILTIMDSANDISQRILELAKAALRLP